MNVRSSSWNIPVGLNFKYPIAGTYTLAGSLGYSSRRYVDETAFASLTSISASMDVFHILTSERDMLVGYRTGTTKPRATPRSPITDFPRVSTAS